MCRIEDRTATRDLRRLTEAGLLRGRGKTRGRYYVADGELRGIAASVLADGPPLEDPYPRLQTEIDRRLLDPEPAAGTS